ncbi:MAG: YhdP family protein [Pseudomonadota bacterium]
MLKKLAKVLAYLIATLVVLLAVALGVLRLALPQLPEYQDEIQAKLAEAIDGDVSFTSLDARWRFHGPEIVFDNFTIGPEISGRTITPVQIGTLRVGVSLSSLVLDQELVVRRLGVDDLVISTSRSEDGWRVQDALIESSETGDSSPVPLERFSPLDVELSNVVLIYQDQISAREPAAFTVKRSRGLLTTERVRLDMVVSEELQRGATADLALNGEVAGLALSEIVAGDWIASAELKDVTASLMSRLLPGEWRLPKEGQADLIVDLRLSDGGMESLVINLDAQDVVPDGGDEQSSVTGRAEWTRFDDGWLCAVEDFVVNVSDRRWPPATATIRSSVSDTATRVQVDASNVTVYDIPYLAAFLPEPLSAQVLKTELAGTLVSLNGHVDFANSAEDVSLDWAQRLQDYDIDTTFEGITAAPFGRIPGVSNLTGSMHMSPASGSVTLASSDAALRLPGVFETPLPLSRLSGSMVWRNSDRGLTLLSDNVTMASGPLTQKLSVEVVIPSDDSGVVVDLDSEFELSDLSRIDELLPAAVVRPKLYNWLTQSLNAGRVEDGRLRLAGNLNDFPFDDGNGEFSASAETKNVTMRYARPWPAITELDATVNFDRMRLWTTSNSGVSGGIPFRDSTAEFKDLRDGRLTVATEGQASLQALYRYSGASPIRNLFGKVFDILELDGNGRYDVDLLIPLKAIRDFQFDATLTTDDGYLGFSTLPLFAEQIRGEVRLDRKGVYASDVLAQVFDRPTTLDLSPAPVDSGFGLRLEADGRVTDQALVEQCRIPLPGRISGETPYTATLWIPKARADADSTKPLTLEVLSSLKGLALDVPYPAGKSAETSNETEVVLLLQDGLSIDVLMDSGLGLVALFAGESGQPLTLERGTLHLGPGRALLPIVPGLFVDGAIDTTRLDDWLSLGDGNGPSIVDKLKSIAVSVDTLDAFGQRIRNVRTGLQASDENWLIDIDSPAVAGNMIIPRDLSADSAILRMDMDRLFLLESDPASGGDSDPTRVPSMQVVARDFSLGQKRFGALDAMISRVANGVVIEKVETKAPSFGISASGDWLLDPVEVSGSRTRMTASITSNDVKAMMNSLGYQPGINAEQLTSQLEISWGGGPSETFVESLDGSATVAINNGTLDEVEPGAGRVVGLMSVAELPRRLALDFRDVFRKGFSFDVIQGDFRMVNGDAFTCNLNLQGSSADVGLIGRASLAKRNYNQTAVVSVKVGNTLPAVGAVVAGPQVGAALLVFSQIFKKPLQGMTEVFYQINGGWDEPSIDRTDSARFAATAELAGCLVNTGN